MSNTYAQTMPETEPNNVLENANLIQADEVRTGMLGEGDDQDWYKIIITEPSLLEVHDSTTNTLGYEVFLYHANAEGLPLNGYRYSDNSGSKLTQYILPGTYYILFWRHWSIGFSGEGTYFFNVELTAFSEDREFNDDMDNATMVTAGIAMSGNLGFYDTLRQDDQDWYKITLDHPSKLTILDSTSNQLEYEVAIYDEAGEIKPNTGYRYSDNTGKQAVSYLLPGTYYVLFWRHWSIGFGGQGSYFFSIQQEIFSEDREYNDVLDSATLITPGTALSGSLGFYDTLRQDDQDWYRVTVDYPSRLTILDSTSNQLEYEVAIYDESGEIKPNTGYRYSDNTGKQAVSYLLPGTYYVLFWRHWSIGFGGQGSYFFKVELTEYSEDSEFNDVIDSAALITSGTAISGSLGFYDTLRQDDQDWYKIILNHPSKVTVVDSTSNQLSYEVAIYDEKGIIKHTTGYRYSDNTGKQAVSYLLPGTYYVLFWRHWSIGFGGQGSYFFNLQTDPYPEDHEFNDNIDSAVIVSMASVISGNLGFYDTLRQDDLDYYAFELEEAGYISVFDTTHGNLSYQVFLLDSAENTLQYVSRFSDDSGSRLTSAVDSGKYYLLFWRRTSIGFGGNGSYHFLIDYLPVPASAFTAYQNENEFLFENNSLWADSYSWWFGDEESSKQVNPVHRYQGPGDYPVTLVSSNLAGTDTLVKVVTIRGIRDVIPRHGGNSGKVTMSIYGGGLSEDGVVSLHMDGGEIIEAVELHFEETGVLQATFDLRGVPAGLYHVSFDFEEVSSVTLENAFTVINGGKSEPWINLVGRDRALLGRWQTYTLEFGNSGNLDAEIVPVWITLSDPDTNELQFVDLQVLYPDFALDNGQIEKLDSITYYFDLDTIWGEYSPTRVYPLYIPRIAAGYSGAIHFKVKTTTTIELNAWMNTPLMENGTLKSGSSVESSKLEDCIYEAKVAALKNVGAAYFDLLVPGSGCIYSIYSEFMTVRKQRMEDFTKQRSWGAFSYSMASLFLSCVSSLTPIGKVYELAIAITSTIQNMHGAYMADKECRDKFGMNSKQNRNVRAVTSFDPNEIVGPAGFTDLHFTGDTTWAVYTIFFENKDTAKAPAQEIFIVDTLDLSVFDISTLRFRSLMLGDSLMQIPYGKLSFAMDVDLRPKQNLIARIIGTTDTITGIMAVHINSLDPINMAQNEDPDLGVLLPNINKPEGEGFVSFQLALNHLDDGDRFENKATITFDFNKPITTNTWVNTIDLNSPESFISNYTGRGNKNYVFEIQGLDQGAGIEFYTLYASYDGYDFQPVFRTSDEQFYFTIPDSVDQSKFYSIATDSLGHTEPLKADAEVLLVHTEVPLAAEKNNIGIAYNAALNILSVEGINEQGILKIVDLSGKTIILQTVGLNDEISVEHLPKGVYIVQLKSGERDVVRKFMR